MNVEEPMPGEIRWRLDQLERRANEVEQKTDDIAVIKVELKILTERVRALTTAAWSVVGGLILLTVSVLFAAGRIG